MQPYAEAIVGARAATATFLEQQNKSARFIVFCHFDADGLAAGAVFGRALPRLGFTNVQVVPSGRGESAFEDQARERLAASEPDALIVTDLGIDRSGVLPNVPTLLVDHHRPEGEPPGAAVVSGYDWEPIPCSAWLAYELLAPLANIEDLSWIAAVGILSDIGDSAPWDALPATKKRYTAKWLKEAVALINASRRASTFDVDTPLRMLMQADHPRAVSENDELGAGKLRAYRAEVNAQLAQARRQAPIFGSTANPPIAIIKIDSPCQVHPLIAQQWRGRLRDHVVICANTGYLPGIVACSARTALKDLSLPKLFQSLDLGDDAGTGFGRGHDQASGGHLSAVGYNRMLDAWGFPERARVPVDTAAL
jgi:single-stranded-DNA-specific exonuclease